MKKTDLWLKLKRSQMTRLTRIDRKMEYRGLMNRDGSKAYCTSCNGYHEQVDDWGFSNGIYCSNCGNMVEEGL